MVKNSQSKSWWDKLTPAAQKAYVKAHPRSKYAKLLRTHPTSLQKTKVPLPVKLTFKNSEERLASVTAMSKAMRELNPKAYDAAAEVVKRNVRNAAMSDTFGKLSPQVKVTLEHARELQEIVSRSKFSGKKALENAKKKLIKKYYRGEGS